MIVTSLWSNLLDTATIFTPSAIRFEACECLRSRILILLTPEAASPYKYVRDWFEKQFPDYRDVNASLSKCDYAVKLVKLPDTNDYEPRVKYDA